MYNLFIDEINDRNDYTIGVHLLKIICNQEKMIIFVGEILVKTLNVKETT